MYCCRLDVAAWCLNSGGWTLAWCGSWPKNRKREAAVVIPQGCDIWCDYAARCPGTWPNTIPGASLMPVPPALLLLPKMLWNRSTVHPPAISPTPYIIAPGGVGRPGGEGAIHVSAPERLSGRGELASRVESTYIHTPICDYLKSRRSSQKLTNAQRSPVSRPFLGSCPSGFLP